MPERHDETALHVAAPQAVIGAQGEDQHIGFLREECVDAREAAGGRVAAHACIDHGRGPTLLIQSLLQKARETLGDGW